MTKPDAEPMTNIATDVIEGYKTGLAGGPMGFVSAAFDCGWLTGAHERAALSEQPAPKTACKGIPRVGCNYLAECDSVCNKCGKVHAVHLIPGVGSTAPVERVALSVTDDMVSRFLSWPLPRDFYPDCGISFDGRRDDEWNKNKTWPIGTNLLTAIQARQMLEHVLGVAHGDME